MPRPRRPTPAGGLPAADRGLTRRLGGSDVELPSSGWAAPRSVTSSSCSTRTSRTRRCGRRGSRGSASSTRRRSTVPGSASSAWAGRCAARPAEMSCSPRRWGEFCARPCRPRPRSGRRPTAAPRPPGASVGVAHLGDPRAHAGRRAARPRRRASARPPRAAPRAQRAPLAPRSTSWTGKPNAPCAAVRRDRRTVSRCSNTPAAPRTMACACSGLTTFSPSSALIGM